MARPTIICLTPVKNEEWILERFLRCASLWADHIIIADQGSTDASRQIAAKFPKVRLIENRDATYNEVSRQQQLLRAAREIPGQRLLLALDADEALSANYHTSAEWPAILSSAPGTIIRFLWANLRPGLRDAWFADETLPWGLMDDGAEHTGEVIHSSRVPRRPDSPTLMCHEIRLLHYQYVDDARMKSKHRWYQCFERVRNPQFSAIRLFDQYHHMHRINPDRIIPAPQEWFEFYEKNGIDMKSIVEPKDGIYWWDPLTLKMMEEHGSKFFAKDDVWTDWEKVVKRMGGDPIKYGDPRTAFQKKLHTFLMHPKTLRNSPGRKMIKSLLKRLKY